MQNRERFLVLTATGLTLLTSLAFNIAWNSDNITAKQSQNLISLCYNRPQGLDLVYYHIFNYKNGIKNFEWRRMASHMVIFTGMVIVGIELVLYLWIAIFLLRHDR